MKAAKQYMKQSNIQAGICLGRIWLVLIVISVVFKGVPTDW